MPLNRSARIAESATTTGAGDITLAGALTGCKTFASACVQWDWFEYLIEAVDAAGMPTGEWEAGIGTYSAANTLTRVLVQGSSASGAGRISFSAGTKAVSLTRLSNNLDTVHQVLRSGTESTAVTAATMITWRPRRSITLTDFTASLSTASSSGVVTLDVRVNGTSLLTTLLSVSANSKTSVGGTAAVFADADLASDDEVTIVCTAAGTGATGLTVTLVGNETPQSFMDGLWLRLTPEDMRAFHTRASAAWAFDANGVLQQYASGVLRVVPSPVGVTSALRELQITNKCTNFNANPTDLTNVTFTNAANGLATCTVVDDTTALAAAGLGTVCSSGKAYKIDNSAGADAAYVEISGTTTNTSAHTVSAYCRATTGTAAAVGVGSNIFAQTIGTAYTRVVGANLTPGSSSALLRVHVQAGNVVLFVLNQMEQNTVVSSPIVVAGSSVTRARDEIKIPVVLAVNSARSHLADFVLASGAQRIVHEDGNSGPTVTTGGNASYFSTGLTTANNYTANTRGKVSIATDASGSGLCLNGGTAVSNSSTQSVQTNNVLLSQIFSGSDQGEKPVYLHEYRLFRTRLVNNKLKRITA